MAAGRGQGHLSWWPLIIKMIYAGINRKGSVLVADGDNHIRDKLLAITDKMGYDVVVASNGEEALDLLLKGSFDIVFTALKMPGI